MASADPRPLVLVNHIGYDVHGSKKVVVQSASDAGYDAFQVVDPDDRRVRGKAGEGKRPRRSLEPRRLLRRDVFPVPETRHVSSRRHGRGGRVTSQPFMMAPKLLPEASISEVLFYLKGQRSSGPSTRPIEASRSSARSGSRPDVRRLVRCVRRHEQVSGAISATPTT